METGENDIEILIDGLDTFRRYYQKMVRARHSIDILAWEISLTFGLVMIDHTRFLYFSIPTIY